MFKEVCTASNTGDWRDEWWNFEKGHVVNVTCGQEYDGKFFDFTDVVSLKASHVDSKFFRLGRVVHLLTLHACSPPRSLMISRASAGVDAPLNPAAETWNFSRTLYDTGHARFRELPFENTYSAKSSISLLCLLLG